MAKASADGTEWLPDSATEKRFGIREQTLQEMDKRREANARADYKRQKGGRQLEAPPIAKKTIDRLHRRIPNGKLLVRRLSGPVSIEGYIAWVKAKREPAVRAAPRHAETVASAASTSTERTDQAAKQRERLPDPRHLDRHAGWTRLRPFRRPAGIPALQGHCRGGASPINSDGIRAHVRGLAGDKAINGRRNSLPGELRGTVKSNSNGYYISLPPLKKVRTLPPVSR